MQKKIGINDLAWIDESEGQYAPVNYLRTSNGDVYGALLPDGTMYLNPEAINANTPIHEFSHVWERMLPTHFDKGVALLKKSKAGRDLIQQLKESGMYGEDENRIAREALNTAIGNKGEKLFNGGLARRVKHWVSDLWVQLGNKLGFKVNPDMQFDEFVSRAVGDILGGKEIVSEAEQATRTETIDFMRDNAAILTDGDFVKDNKGNVAGVKPKVMKVITEEKLRIEQDAKSKGTWLKAPNGKDTQLDEAQWVAVRTERFKNWFGDWENVPEEASKFVDENGEPKLFYHRSPNGFTAFDKTRFGKNTDAGWLGEGFYFYGDVSESYGYGDISYEVFLNVKEPYYATNEDNLRLSEMNNIEESKTFSEKLKDEGYDGVYFNGDFRQEAVVFDPGQIKSAANNKGTFGAETNNINFQKMPRKAFIEKMAAKGFTEKIAAELWDNADKSEDEPKADSQKLIASMKENAVPAPALELTPENWEAEFGETGMVQTPIGEVKMGENQYFKLLKNKREQQFGMIKPTLQDPDVVMEENSPEKGAERDSKYLFVKSFTQGGEKVYHFENVTVSKDGKEVVISSHIANNNALERKIETEKILHVKKSLRNQSLPDTNPIGENQGSTSPANNEAQNSGKPGALPKSDFTDKGTNNNEPETTAGIQASPKSQQPTRIQVAPLKSKSTEAKPLNKIMADAAKGTGTDVVYGIPSSKRAGGTYDSRTAGVTIRYKGDLDTTAHELGHKLDDKFGVLADLVHTPDYAVEAELQAFSPHGSKPPEGHPDPKKYERAEGFAEFLRALVVNPDAAKAAAPELYKLYEKKVPEAMRREVERFSNDVREWAGMPAVDRLLSNIQMDGRCDLLSIFELT